MPYFSYEAIDKRGATKTGTLSAATEKEAVEKIRSQALYPVKVYQVLDAGGEEQRASSPAKRLFSGMRFRRKPPMKHFVPFLNDLSQLINAGIPLVRSLTILESQSPSAELRTVIRQVREDVEGGSSFTDALKHYPHVFPPIFVNMVRTGEIGGMLDRVLERLAIFAEKTAELRARIRSAVAYPIVVLCFALAVVFFLVAYVVPKMFVIFEDVGTELPAVTLALFNLSTFLRTKWYVLILAVAVFVGCFQLLLRVERARFFTDGLKLRLPVFGPLAQKVALARFARTFATLTQSGVPILTTLSVVEESTGNLVFKHALTQVRSGIREGESISGPLSTFAIFPAVVTNMIRVGEETGALAEVLAKVADRYDNEVEITLATLTSLLEPVLIILLGVVVGFIVIALFLPMVPLIEKLSAM